MVCNCKKNILRKMLSLPFITLAMDIWTNIWLSASDNLYCCILLYKIFEVLENNIYFINYTTLFKFSFEHHNIKATKLNIGTFRKWISSYNMKGKFKASNVLNELTNNLENNVYFRYNLYFIKPYRWNFVWNRFFNNKKK